jgi:hypothetical protein
MLIPHYWAEARLQHKAAGKQVTVRRWGWSDASQTDAQTLAEKRVQDAMQRAPRPRGLARGQGVWPLFVDFNLDPAVAPAKDRARC